jgi:16S rRNA (uracil1498-N3)-methyltransferase
MIFKDSTLILIGPEGDFSNNEVSDALKNGFKSIGLGNRILRTETAVLKALSIQ